MIHIRATGIVLLSSRNRYRLIVSLFRPDIRQGVIWSGAAGSGIVIGDRGGGGGGGGGNHVQMDKQSTDKRFEATINNNSYESLHVTMIDYINR